jgi:hypothetical protein
VIEGLKCLLEFAKILVGLIQSGDSFALVILIVSLFLAAFLINCSKILDFFEGRKKLQIKRLQEAINCEHLDVELKEFLVGEIQREYFRYFTGIVVDKQYRDKLLEIHLNSNGNLPFYNFSRASSYLIFHNNDVSVHIGTLEIVFYWFNMFLATISGLFFVYLFMLPLYITPKPKAFMMVAPIYVYSIFFLALAIIFLVQKFPMVSAKLIRRELEKANAKPIQPTTDTLEYSIVAE